MVHRYIIRLLLVSSVSGLVEDLTTFKITREGNEYIGTHSTTVSGLTCQRWDSNTPHDIRNNTYIIDSSFPNDRGVSGANNYCRNPDYEFGGPWCYTRSADIKWQSCRIPNCHQGQEPKIAIMDQPTVIIKEGSTSVKLTCSYLPSTATMQSIQWVKYKPDQVMVYNWFYLNPPGIARDDLLGRATHSTSAGSVVLTILNVTISDDATYTCRMKQLTTIETTVANITLVVISAKNYANDAGSPDSAGISWYFGYFLLLPSLVHTDNLF